MELRLQEFMKKKNDICEYGNRITVKSIEFRSVLGSKFDNNVDFTIMCNRYKNEGDLNKDKKKKLLAEFLQRKQQDMRQ